MWKIGPVLRTGLSKIIASLFLVSLSWNCLWKSCFVNAHNVPFTELRKTFWGMWKQAFRHQLVVGKKKNLSYFSSLVSRFEAEINACKYQSLPALPFLPFVVWTVATTSWLLSFCCLKCCCRKHLLLHSFGRALSLCTLSWIQSKTLVLAFNLLLPPTYPSVVCPCVHSFSWGILSSSLFLPWGIPPF